MTPAKRDARAVPLASSGLNVPGLVHSNAATRIDPATTSARLVVMVSFECRLHRRGSRRLRATLRITGNPSEPMNTPMMMGMSTHQSDTNGSSP